MTFADTALLETMKTDIAEINHIDYLITSLSQRADSGPRSLAIAALRQGLTETRAV